MAFDAASLFTEINASAGPTVRANQFGPSVKRLGKGSLVQFIYNFAKPGHDQTPLVVLTDVMPNYFRGVNLHYLTFPAIKKILQRSGLNACNNQFFSYSNIKTDGYIKTAFRMYKRVGVRRLKVMDCDFVLNALGAVRAIDPQEIEAIRSNIKEQLQKTVNQSIPNMPQVET